MLLLTLSLTACNKNKALEDGKYEVYQIVNDEEYYVFDIELPDDEIMFVDNYFCVFYDTYQHMWLCRDLDYYIFKPITE